MCVVLFTLMHCVKYIRQLMLEMYGVAVKISRWILYKTRLDTLHIQMFSYKLACYCIKEPLKTQ